MTASIRGQSLTHQITHKLGIAILTGVYSADNPIPFEADLCREYNASRPVLRASRNRFYAQLTGFISTALRISIRTTNRYKGMHANVGDHKKVADAIIAGRATAAGDAMRKIIQEVMDLINSREELQAGRRTVANSGR